MLEIDWKLENKVRELLSQSLSPIFSDLHNLELSRTADFNEANVITRTNDDGYKNLRLDFELPLGDDVHLLLEASVPLGKRAFEMYTVIFDDLRELILDGDTESRDPTLKSIDGAHKLNKTPVAVHIANPTMYFEYRPRKDSLEFTLYFLIKVDFEQ